MGWRDPLAAYKAADIPTVAEAADDIKYYGFIDHSGSWYILRTVDSSGTQRFARGSSNYDTAWAARVSQIYTYYDLVF